MKLVRYGAAGAERPGVLDGDGNIRDLSAHIDDVAGKWLGPASLAAIAKIAPENLPLISDGPRIGACVGSSGKFICIGLNYADHAAETGKPVPPEPGDIIATGTPPGCGLGVKPVPVFLKAGQDVQLAVEGLGRQRHRTIQA